jgi:acyl-CoA synthetase (AMP-forming)/AMP-acid ligase II
MTEIAGLGTTHSLYAPPVPGSIGVSLPGIEVRIADLEDTSKSAAFGVAGELMIRGPIVMKGYYKNDKATAETIEVDGWLHTGDIATMDATGHVFVVDRRKDMIITGGFNVYPREVEDVISTHPAVSAVAVIGVPDERWGESVKAVVVRRPGASVEAEELISLVKDAKGSVQAPKSVDFIDAIPLSALGKPDKKALRAQYWGDGSRQVN